MAFPPSALEAICTAANGPLPGTSLAFLGTANRWFWGEEPGRSSGEEFGVRAGCMPPESACAAIAINADISFAGRRNGEVRPRMESLARQRQALEIQGNLLAVCN